MSSLNELLQILKVEITPKTLMPVEISNLGREDLPNIFKFLGFTKGAEVGVLSGEFSEKLCSGIPNLKLYCIDPWTQTDGFRDYTNHTLSKNYDTARSRLKSYDVEIIKKTSMVAVSEFEDNSLDFVYIDADHTFKNIVLDICEWIKKIKINGIISGHDFNHYNNPGIRVHVTQAVTGYTNSYQIFPWFVLGKDKEKSWMWMKQK